MYYDLLRTILFRLDPETAHRVGLVAMETLAALGPANPLRQTLPHRPRQLMGLEFPNVVGVAAGLDKNGDCMAGLAALGFGFIEVGTVTPRPQPGNPKPRLFRLKEQQALINRLGFNNKGVDYLAGRVSAGKPAAILGINIGKNLATPVENALDDYRTCLRKVYGLADYVTVNISSPNTPGLRSLQGGESLETLLSGLAAEREKLSRETGRRVPIAVKIAPDLTPEELPAITEALLRHGMDGVIASNTTLSREGVESSPYAGEAGGLSGRPLFEKSTALVTRLSDLLQGELPIIACGGIFGAQDAKAKLDAGASLVQIYTGFIYRGPALVKEIGAL
jgi:dihydroorotate dehydrogenase